jgi:hypothetical protein
MVTFRKIKEYRLDDPLHRWLVYFDEHSPVELVEEVVKMDAAIQLAQDKLEMIARDPELLRAYEQYEKAASDWTTGINGAKREGAKKLYDLIKSGKTPEEALRILDLEDDSQRP